ncbi:C-type lectin domain family 2 member D isoform X2 [Anolis carolinensis]|uniref:C-type lectin domain family 2 member D isoform X2 n=1 Tax=Anolis carolinensis TaxID=28377 RepID=UPI002F2B18EC
MAEAHIKETRMNLNEEEKGAEIEAVKMPLGRRSCRKAPFKKGSSLKNCWCYKSERGEWVVPVTCFSLVILTMTVIILILAILFTERKNEGCPDLLPAVFADPCPKGWLGYQMKCYYFSVNEGNWTSGNSHCSSHNASLAVVGSQETLDFFLRYKSPPDHWIGLQKDSGQPWRWINGSIFTGQLFTLPTEKGRRCAYLNHKGVASSSCTREELWICSKDIFKGNA